MTGAECKEGSGQGRGAGVRDRGPASVASNGPSPHASAYNEAEGMQIKSDGLCKIGRECALPAGSAISTTSIDDSFIKPANDDMNYRHLALPNGLRVLLVSDPTTDKAGAAMDVRVGSLSDPDHLPGLAHFTEHMLFYSSEKYPEEDEYTKFISDRGGSTNAYTAAEHTNYHFDINWESLGPALDRFAQFFIAPTISRNGIEREVKAVDSEHGKNLLSDPWRKSQVNKATANPRHPWARFATGNQETLYSAPLAAGIDPRDGVVEFYSRHYSADRCALTVMGRQTVEELESMVRSMFGSVPNRQPPRPDFGADVYLPDQMGVLIQLVPVREGQSLELTWQVPPSERLFREQPLGYLSHLLGHEGEGSVFALLKAAGWASALWAGEGGGSTSFASFFTVHVDLTEEGQRHIKDVATTVFRYLALLRRPEGICQRIWEEVRGLAQLQFDTRDRSKPLAYCTSLSSGLQLYPPKELLPAVYGVPLEFSPAAIREALELLTPRRVRALWSSKCHLKAPGAVAAAAAPPEAAAAAVEAEAIPQGEDELLTEPVYGTRYGIKPLPADWLEAWEAARPDDEQGLHLPAPNRFIPTDLSLADDEAAAGPPEPTVVAAVPGRLRLWHKPDTRFRQPKAVLYLDVQSPEAYTSPRAAVMTRLFTKLMLDYLNEVAYPAQQAGLDYNVINTQSGWQLLLSGYNHKLPELLREVLQRLADFKVLPDRFEFVREGLVREYANQLHNQPYSWAMYRAEMLTTARRWPIELYGSQAAAITADELQSHVRRLCSRCFVEGLAAGNLRRGEVLRCGALLLTCLRDRCGAAPLHPAEAPELRVLQIPPTPEPSPALSAPPAPVPQPPLQSPPSRGTSSKPAEAGTAAGGTVASAAASEGPTTSASGGVRECGEGDGGGPAAAVQPVSGGWVFSEDVPSGQDDNSAALVMYQVGPDDLRLNALRSLLVQLAKRDAFSELRTRQQLGYIVSLHGGAEHGVGYVEMLVQSNAYDAEGLCRRLDDFMHWFLETGLPAKCGLVAEQRSGGATMVAATASQPPPSPPSPSACGGAQEPAADTAVASASGRVGADDAATADVSPATAAAIGSAAVGSTVRPRTEFEVAVEELAKSKLEKPKKLGDLANRWWSEVHHGCYCFNRQEAEVAELYKLTPGELISFVRDLLTGSTTAVAADADAASAAGSGGGGGGGASAEAGDGVVRHRSKLSVQIHGKSEAARAGERQSECVTAPGPASASSIPTAGLEAAATGSLADQNSLSGQIQQQDSAQAAALHQDRRRLPYFYVRGDEAFAWKHGCIALPSVRVLWATRRAAAGWPPIPDDVAQEELKRL